MNDLVLRAITTLQSRRGVTAAEYAVLAVGIVVVVGLAAQTLGTTISGKFTSIFATTGTGAGTGATGN